MTAQDRLESLEFKLAHLEHGLQELSEIVVRQQQEIERLRAQNGRLVDQIEDLRSPGDSTGEQHEVPPHY